MLAAVRTAGVVGMIDHEFRFDPSRAMLTRLAARGRARCAAGRHGVGDEPALRRPLSTGAGLVVRRGERRRLARRIRVSPDRRGTRVGAASSTPSPRWWTAFQAERRLDGGATAARGHRRRHLLAALPHARRRRGMMQQSAVSGDRASPWRASPAARERRGSTSAASALARRAADPSDGGRARPRSRPAVGGDPTRQRSVRALGISRPSSAWPNASPTRSRAGPR